MIWKEISIDEIKSDKKYSLVGGPFGSDLSGIHYVDFGIPIIRGTNLPFDKRFSNEDFVYVSKEKANKLVSNTAYPGDLIFTQRGTLGQVGIVPFSEFDRYIISQSQMKLTLDNSKADPLFVYYFFRTKECRMRIENLALSSGVPHINLRILKEFKIPFPPLPIQHKIASNLSVYDELIEYNQQRLKLLEEIAKEIYKEWFVRLRFPGHEITKFFNEEGKEVPTGTFRAVPDGWENVKLDLYLKFEKGIEPGSNSYSDEKSGDNYLPFLRVGDLGARENSIYVHKDLLKGKILIKDDIAITLDGTVGLVAMNLYGGFSSGIRKIVYKSDRIKKAFAYFTLLSDNIQGTIKAHAAGTTILHAGSSINYMKILLPTNSIVAKFDEIVNPMLQEVLILRDKNQLLQQTRDLLLPRLISGKLSVEHLVNKDEVNLSLAVEPEAEYQTKK